MFDLVSTYRIQFHKGFGLSDLEDIIPYLHQLGVRTIYASPIFKAVPGSVHGYDITDPHTINPEVGSIDQLYQISAKLKERDMFWLQDIVPNHMAMHEENNWLMDVLKNGSRSRYANYFDIDLEHPQFKGKLMMPVLSTSLEDALAKGDIQLVYKQGVYRLQCNGISLPLNDASLSMLPEREPVEAMNNNKKVLSAIIDRQHYLLCHSEDTNKQINYRRFFTINGLISLNMQREEVFDDYHSLIKKLCDDGIFQGLRVDHIDGLYDPAEYLCRLRRLVGKDMYIVVEKILQHAEALSADWSVAGSTGYDFLGIVNNVFTAPGAVKHLVRHYKGITGQHTDLAHLACHKKLLILHEYMAGDLDGLCRMAESLLHDYGAIISPTVLKTAISMFLAKCSVYRYYGSVPLVHKEALAVERILQELDQEGLAKEAALLRYILIEHAGKSDSDHNERATHFYRRCMQVAGPLMAKGIEDTLMYTWNCHIGHNEVGDTPGSRGCSADDFHVFMLARRQHWPLAMNTTATHDTKRGEDARCRLNMLTIIATEWLRYVSQWHDTLMQGDEPIAPGDEYLIYQALQAAWPNENAEMPKLKERFNEYIVKALREGKERSNWQKPDTEYEERVLAFVDVLLNSGQFRNAMDELQAAINEGSMGMSLCQLLLKMTSPGIPDLYQGNELWDLSMVDPDNRRPVHYDVLKKWLEDIPEETPAEWWAQLWHYRADGRIKLALTHKLLKERDSAYAVFSMGEYIPLKVSGKHKKHVLAFARRSGQATYVVIVPLHTQGISFVAWADTVVKLPGSPGDEWQHVLSDEQLESGGDYQLAHALHTLPFVFLKSVHKPNKRSSGILMPVFSLPSPYGIGDLGESAYKFIDFLKNAHQKVWQLLPLNPTVAGEAYSPYSSISAMAMNTLLIAPDKLMEYGLLKEDELQQWQLPLSETVDYEQCRAVKENMLQMVWQRFTGGGLEKMRVEFDEFCIEHANWLDDLALYVSIKQEQQYAPWYQWPMEYRTRQHDVLNAFAATHEQEIAKIKWLQYLVCKQWGEVRQYAAVSGITLFGDMPFYVSYDSVDVWARPELFCIDKEGRMTGVAGVPPDLFSETGQLWNMPTYNWEELERTNYKWWIDRIRRNLEIFDLVRIDHFRAFEAYWQVAAGADTAEQGKWIKGPGMHFFDVVGKEIQHLPLIAEDLGDEMQDVYKLRDRTGLPGMKVLQFAWGDNMPTSVDVPHNHTENCVVYTGTHDNNTTRGWWKEDVKEEDRNRLCEYIGQKVTEANVHTVLLRTAYASVANMAIIPIQDVLGLDGNARINTPGSGEGNWVFRLRPDVLTPKIERMLRELTFIYNRY